MSTHESTIPVSEVREVAWKSLGETLTGTFRRTGDFCVRCGTRGTWASGDGSRQLCTSCGTLLRLNEPPKPAEGLWAEVLEQLQA